METSLPRVRGLVVSERAFRRLTLGTVAMLVVIVVSGATVRLTGSGLGCEHWPGCSAGDPLPTNGFHGDMEFSNRIVSGVAVVVVLALWLGSLLAASAPRWVRWTAGAMFLLTLGEAPLGAITVHYHLNPWLVGTHFLLAIAVLGLGVLIAVDAWHLQSAPVPWGIQSIALLGLVSCAVLVVTGTLATGAGPHSGSVIVPRIWSLHPAVWLHVRATAVFGVGLALVVAWLVRHRNGNLRYAVPILAVLLVQMAIGEIQYRSKLPWGLVLVHVTLASLLWASVVAFTVMLMRPSRMAR